MAANGGGAAEQLSALLRAGRDAALCGSGALTLVLGNEAADLDSIACAASVAALLQSGGTDAAALVSVPRADLRLRPEVAWLFEREGIDAQALLFADEMDPMALKASSRPLHVVLVGVRSAWHTCARRSRPSHHRRRRRRPQQTGARAARGAGSCRGGRD